MKKDLLIDEVLNNEIYNFHIVVRPIIDLFWDINLINIGGKVVNLAGFISIFLSVCFLLFIILNKKINIILFIVFLYITVISLIFSRNLGDLDNYFRIISTFIYFAYIGKEINKSQLENIMKWYLIVLLIPAIITILQVLGYFPYFYFDYIEGIKINRATGGYRQPSVLTRYIAFGVVFCLYFIDQIQSKIYKNILKIYLLFIIFVSSFSYHRMGILIIIIIPYIWSKIHFKKKYTLGSFIIMFISIGCILLVYNGWLDSFYSVNFKKLFDLNNIATIENGKINFVLRGRAYIVDEALYYLKKQPVLITLIGNGKNYSIVNSFELKIADMDLLRIIWNYGIIGLIMWFLIFCKITKNLIHMRKKIVKKDYLRVLNLNICILIIYFAFGLILEATITPNLLSFLMLFTSFSFAQYNKLQIIDG